MERDFDGVDFVNEPTTRPAQIEVAPSGEHIAKIIDAEKYKSQAGNWTLRVVFQIEGGKYRDHKEWYNLWNPDPDAKRISNEIFSALAKAVGFKQFPTSVLSFVNKQLVLDVIQVPDSFTNNEGNEIQTTRLKVLNYNKFDDGSPSVGKPTL
ncbi:MAG: hypothetical protein CMI74_06920 [Candidatus Pelagibacter sp.]|jgi:hypothetical protein|nr:hypothetical protein [Candidatus Pelagibacter sp.]|tara:strand:- start:2296 stop:2751 length:456 start_codon:yes stop_codon:yes gene_type:complete